MPIYEYYCPDNHTIYQFYAKTLAQAAKLPRCPDNPKFRLQKMVSGFAITGRGGAEPPTEAPAAGTTDQERRLDAAMDSMESEFSGLDENDPKHMARMMRRMSEAAGEKIDGQLEEVVRKLEEGADPESLDDQLPPDGPAEDSGDPEGGGMGLDPGMPDPLPDQEPRERRHRFRARRAAPRRDPKLHDFA